MATILTWILQWNDALMELPAGGVVALFAIAVGYVLKSASMFNNKYIPLAVVSLTTLAFPVVQFCADHANGKVGAGWRVPLYILMGTVWGFLAWLFHAQVLRRLVDPHVFSDNSDNPKQ